MGMFDGVTNAVTGAIGGVANVGGAALQLNPTGALGMWGMPIGRQLQGAAGGLQAGGPGGYSMPGGGPEPMAPTWQSQLDPSGQIKDVYRQKNLLNTQGLDALRGEALRDPSQMSKWRSLAQGQAMDQFGQQQAGQLAGAQANLAAQGGLSSGARERLQRSSMLGGMQGQQDIWGKMAMQDEQNRLGSLQALPGQELNAANYGSNIDQSNIGRAMGEVAGQRNFDQNRYAQQMGQWGAMNTAAAVPQTQDRGFFGNMFGGLLGGR